MLWIDRWIGDGLVMGCVKKNYFKEGGLVESFPEKFLVC